MVARTVQRQRATDFGRALRQFDYGTISDAILHVKYTAREDAGPFKNGVVAHLRDYFSQDARTPVAAHVQSAPGIADRSGRASSIRSLPADGNVLELEMSPRFFRALDQEKTLKIQLVWVLARCTETRREATRSSSLRLPPAPPRRAPIDHDAAHSGKQYGGWQFSQKDVTDLGIAVETSGPAVKWQLQMTSGGANLKKNATGKVEVEDLILVLGYHWD